MDKQQAIRLKARIEREEPNVQVAGINTYTGPRGRVTHRTLPCIDRRTGVPFVVTGPEDWDERKRDAVT